MAFMSQNRWATTDDPSLVGIPYLPFTRRLDEPVQRNVIAAVMRTTFEREKGGNVG
jgi:hypothetical protein